MMGAGVIPFCVNDQGVSFLLHKTFSGRRAGCLVDFGGGSEDGESHLQTAVREFVEETETLYFAADPECARADRKQVAAQLPLVAAVFHLTLAQHPDWYCTRASASTGKIKDWRTFFIQFEYRDLSPLNRQWQQAESGRFKKKRQLLWVPARDLLSIWRNSPEQLWKRLRELRGLESRVGAIMTYADSLR